MDDVSQSAKSKTTARMSLNLPARQGDDLDQMALTTGLTKNELLRQAVALLTVAVKARERGLELAFAETNSDMVKERVVSLV